MKVSPISQVRQINNLTQSVTIGVLALTHSTLGWVDDRSFSGWQPILKYSGIQICRMRLHTLDVLVDRALCREMVLRTSCHNA